MQKKNSTDSRGKGKFSFSAFNNNIQIIKRKNEKDDMTVPETEINALSLALDWLLPYCNNSTKNVVIFSDSELVVKWLSGQYACRADNIKPLYTSCKDRIKVLENKGVAISVEKIDRKDNKAHVGF